MIDIIPAKNKAKSLKFPIRKQWNIDQTIFTELDFTCLEGNILACT